MKGWHSQYTPLSIDANGMIDKGMYEQYLVQSFWPSQLELIVIEPLNDAIKNSGRLEHDFNDFKVKVSNKNSSSTNWSEVYEKVKTFLEVRSDDSKAAKMPELKYVEGVGYCISIESILKEIKDNVDRFTSKSSYLQVNWPKKKRDEPPVRDVIIPNIDYSRISREAALIALLAKRFCSSLEEEVIKAYKTANEIWIGRETGYSRETIPPKEESPLRRVRHVGDLRYIAINLVREDKHNYGTLMNTIAAELSAIKEGGSGEFWELYRPTRDGFVNIKRLLERLENLYNSPDNPKIYNPDVRYEILP